MKSFLKFLFCTLAASAFAATSVTDNGITWTFAADMTTGQFISGDYWVVGPVAITNISPASAVVTDRAALNPTATLATSTINGSMVNPTAGPNVQQGLDSDAYTNSAQWNAALNRGRPDGSDLSAENPLVLQPGDSLLTVTSREPARQDPSFTNAAVLTVLDEEPPADAFRPTYVNTEKRIFRYSDIVWANIKEMPLPAPAPPTFATLEDYWEKVQVEFRTDIAARGLMASNNMPLTYGREIGNATAAAAVRLNSSASEEEKETLLIRFLQYGIDIYGAAKGGGDWVANGGHRGGRKMALVFAAMAFDDADMKVYCDGTTHRIFQEDQQTFIVDADIVAKTGGSGTSVPYTGLSTGGQTVTVTRSGGPSIVHSRAIMVTDAVPSEYNGFWKINNSAASGVTFSFTVHEDVVLPGPLVSATLTYLVNWGPDFRSIVYNYDNSDLDMPEWAGEGDMFTVFDGNNSLESNYRSTNSSYYVATATVARVMDVQTLWNHEAFFEYAERWAVLTNETTPGTINNTPLYAVAYYDTYWNGIPDAPLPTSMTVGADGVTLVVEWSEACAIGVGGSGGMEIVDQGVTKSLSYVSGSGTTTFIYTIPSSVKAGSYVSANYNQPGNGIEASDGGIDVFTFAGLSVINDSEVQVPAAMSNGSRQRLFPGGGGF